MTAKNQIELEKIKSSTDKFGRICDIFKHLISTLGALVALYIIMEGLKPFLSSSPDVIDSIAHIIEKLNVSNILGYFLSLGISAGWYLERQGKKRAIKLKGEYQKQIEQNDLYRSSSGLTKTGETPRG